MHIFKKCIARETCEWFKMYHIKMYFYCQFNIYNSGYIAWAAWWDLDFKFKLLIFSHKAPSCPHVNMPILPCDLLSSFMLWVVHFKLSNVLSCIFKMKKKIMPQSMYPIFHLESFLYCNFGNNICAVFTQSIAQLMHQEVWNWQKQVSWNTPSFYGCDNWASGKMCSFS